MDIINWFNLHVSTNEMKKAIVIIILLLSTGIVKSQSIQDTSVKIIEGEWLDDQMYPGIYSISIIELICNPDKYDGKKVMFEGYLNLGFENSAIYLHQEDSEHLLTKNGLWIILNDYLNVNINLKEFDNQYVQIYGFFDSKGEGHMNAFSGTIKDVFMIVVRK